MTITPRPPSLCFSAMAGTFPGAPSIDALWQLLASGRSADSASMLTRWNLHAEHIHHPRPGAKDRVYLHKAFNLTDSAGTADLLQGRQLSIGQQVLDDLLGQCAGLDRQRTALIVATSWSDESYFIASARPAETALQGYTPAQQITRLASHAKLGGPALTVDTACSSFPYALDMARALMDSGQADQVVVMALNTLMPPALFLGFSQLTAFSPRARLQAFGEQADGIVPGECAVAFVLEPVSQAVAAQRQPLGLLRAVGLSADGAEGSTFAPGAQAQYIAYQRAWQGLDPASVSYLESHGTGTPLGDATELSSLQRFFGAHRTGLDKIPLGSIKSTIGHPLAAAGGPALAKALLMLRHRHFAPQIDYPASPKIAATCLKLAAPTVQPLEADSQALRIGISSFGFGGANAHVVVEEYRPQAAPAPAPAGHPMITLDLVVVGAEAALGATSSLQALQEQWQRPAVAPCNFPAGRFGDALTGQPALSGHFLAHDRVIDIDGYGMGPKPLGHVDPFKLLITDRVGQLLRRLPGVAGAATTAMIMCCNMGGERFTNAYSIADRHYGHGEGAGPGIEVADVATMLPCMLSGFPAKVFDLRGFHQTLAGAPGLFWQTLLAAPQWFDQGIETVLLGAGRFLSGAVEVMQAYDADVPQGEGLGVIALRRHGQCGPHTPLLHLHSALPGHAAATAEQACQLLGLPTGASMTQCQLQASATDPLQAVTGYLAEASGIATLLQALAQGARERLIAVRNGERVVLWLHAEQLNAWQPSAPAPVKSPFTLRFAHAHPAAGRQEEPAQAHAIEGGIDVLALSDTLTNTLLCSLNVRSRALQALLSLSASAPAKAGSVPWQRQPRNSVINHVLQRSTHSLHARLVVDEAHPYFFDHPLDHVPGILLIEGALQLAEYAVPGLRGNTCFIHRLNIKFHRYVRKERPVDIELQRQGDSQVFIARIMQDEQLACVCTLAIAPGQAPAAPPPGTQVLPSSRQAWLHKARAENVLVGDINAQAQVQTAAVPAGHFFEDGHRHWHSMVYFLEVARQAYMQIAHGPLKIALNTPMNLLALTFNLNRPLNRGQTLMLAPQTGLARDAQAFKTNRMVIELRADGHVIGEAHITAQVLNEQAVPA